MELENLVGKEFGIKPDSSYNRKQFVEEAGRLFDVEKAYRKLRESNLTDREALDDLIGIAGEYAVGDKEENYALWAGNPSLALEQGKALLDKGYSVMANFVKRNRSSLLDKLSAEQLYALFSRIPLYKTENKEANRIRDLRDKVMEMQRVAQEGGDVGSVVAEEVEELIKNVSEEQRRYIGRNRHLIIPSLIKSIATAIQREFAGLFRDKEGELNKSALIKYLEANYKVAEKFIDNVPEDEKEDYWSDNLKPYCIEIARGLYSSEKKEEKKEKPEEKRKAKAREIGLVA